MILLNRLQHELCIAFKALVGMNKGSRMLLTSSKHYFRIIFELIPNICKQCTSYLYRRLDKGLVAFEPCTDIEKYRARIVILFGSYFYSFQCYCKVVLESFVSVLECRAISSNSSKYDAFVCFEVFASIRKRQPILRNGFNYYRGIFFKLFISKQQGMTILLNCCSDHIYIFFERIIDMFKQHPIFLNSGQYE